MSRLLLDYDNTICNFSQMMCNRWNKITVHSFEEHPFYIEDVKDYSLHKCLLDKGYDKQTVDFLIDNFWFTPNIYQEEYIDMPCREIILKIVKEFSSLGYEIVLHTMCCSNEMAISKLEKLYKDYDLLKYVSEIKLDLLVDKKNYIKDTDYDVVIDDNPIFIKEYLEKNPTGVAFVPKWIYNDVAGINDNKRITMIG